MILHRKRVLTNRPDGIDATLIRGISAWDDDHDAPPMLAYAFVVPSRLQLVVPNNNMPDTEIQKARSRYDFTYVKQARIVVGVDYGSAKIFLKYSKNLTTWSSFDGAGGPFITQTQGNANPTTYASGWVDLVADAKADVWVAPFYRGNTDISIIQIGALHFYVR